MIERMRLRQSLLEKRTFPKCLTLTLNILITPSFGSPLLTPRKCSSPNMADFLFAQSQDVLLRAKQDEVENIHHFNRYNIIPQLNFEAKDYTENIP